MGFYLIFLFIVINILNAIWFLGIVKHLLRNLGLIENPKRPQQKQEREEDEDNQPLINKDEGDQGDDALEGMAGGERQSVNGESQGPSARGSGGSKEGVRKREGRGSGSDY